MGLAHQKGVEWVGRFEDYRLTRLHDELMGYKTGRWVLFRLWAQQHGLFALLAMGLVMWLVEGWFALAAVRGLMNPDHVPYITYGYLAGTLVFAFSAILLLRVR
ncbi:MAG: hypothetical protein DRO11_03755 [Methanobacteriota archaeon]|nr:MAG: hypothetical protein DRO11_03755 [Euryarchaeota archaeon]